MRKKSRSYRVMVLIIQVSCLVPSSCQGRTLSTFPTPLHLLGLWQVTMLSAAAGVAGPCNGHHTRLVGHEARELPSRRRGAAATSPDESGGTI